MKILKFPIILIAGLASTALALPASAAVFTNGSFETGPSSTTNFSGPTTNSTDIPGWTLNVPTNSRARYESDGFFGLLDASDGQDQIIFNNGQQNPGSSIFQTFDTVIGVQYQVLFDVGFVDTTGTNSGFSLGISGTTDATLTGIATVTRFEAASVDNPDVYVTDNLLLFTADSLSTTLTFTDVSTGTDAADVALDNVRLSTVIPEPASIALIGLGGLCLLGRRRHA